MLRTHVMPTCRHARQLLQFCGVPLPCMQSLAFSEQWQHLLLWSISTGLWQYPQTGRLTQQEQHVGSVRPYSMVHELGLQLLTLLHRYPQLILMFLLLPIRLHIARQLLRRPDERDVLLKLTLFRRHTHALRARHALVEQPLLPLCAHLRATMRCEQHSCTCTALFCQSLPHTSARCQWPNTEHSAKLCSSQKGVAVSGAQKHGSERSAWPTMAKASHASLCQAHLIDLLHGFDGLVHQLPVVLLRPVPPPFHFKRSILSHTGPQLACHVQGFQVAGWKVETCCWRMPEIKTMPCGRARQSDARIRTSASSLPATFLYAFVHRTLRGLRFILKFLWHLLRQNLKICSEQAACQNELWNVFRLQLPLPRTDKDEGAEGGGGGATVASLRTNVMP